MGIPLTGPVNATESRQINVRGETMHKGTILVVDDEPDILEVLAYNLTKEGYRVVRAGSGEQALAEVQKRRPDLIILDLMLPGIDGLEVCKAVRALDSGATLPVIMLSAKDGEVDVVTGLEVGADDYIAKPFSTRVLLARVKTVLHQRRMHSAESGPAITVGEIVIVPGEHECRVRGMRVELTVTEFRILATMMRRPGWVFSRDQIVETSRGENTVVTLRSVDVHVVRLRQKLEPCGSYIDTVRGVGYRLRVPQQLNS